MITIGIKEAKNDKVPIHIQISPSTPQQKYPPTKQNASVIKFKIKTVEKV
jgi:hypothetical protein